MSETELAVSRPAESSQLAVYDPALLDTGLGEVAKLKPTQLIIVQPTTRDPKGARLGQILDVLMEEPYDSVEVVPLRIWRQRVLFPPGGDLDSEPLCKSNDGVAPSDQAKAPQSVRCKTCPHARWNNGQRSACQEKRRLIVVLRHNGLPRVMTVGGVGVPVLQNVIDKIAQIIAVSKQNGKTLALYDFILTMSAEKIVGKKGTYFVPRFGKTTLVDVPGTYAPMLAEIMAAKNSFNQEEALVESEQKVERSVDGAVDAVLVDEV